MRIGSANPSSCGPPGSRPLYLRGPIRAGRSAGADLDHIHRLVKQGAVAVVICGEPGTGRRRLARAFHEGYCRDAPFLLVECSARCGEQLARLFCRAGVSGRPLDPGAEGAGSSSASGTLVFHEADRLGFDLKWTLLRRVALESARHGNKARTEPTVRMAVTLRSKEDTDGAAADSPLNHLGVPVVRTTPLRERPEDIPSLVEDIVRQCNQEFGLAVQHISTGASALLVRYSWPGNIRQLSSVIREAVTRDIGDTLLVAHLPHGFCARALEEANTTIALSGNGQYR